MLLHYAAASPFVRKVMVMVLEVDLADRIERRTISVSPTGPNTELNIVNPLGKIPCLITDDGQPLYDSRVICEYLDGLHDKPRLFPPAGPARWQTLRQQAMGDGMADAAVSCRYETFLRPTDRQWDKWLAAQRQKISRALDALEAEATRFSDILDTIGPIAIACALGYLDFRLPDLGWREGRPELAGWYEAVRHRRSMQATEPA